MKRWLLLAANLVSLAVATGCGTTGPDLVAPATPVGFGRIGGGDGESRFGWQKSREKDLAGYKMYRAVGDPAADYQLIATISRDSTAYTDRNLDYTVQFHYKLTAFDQSGNESSMTLPILAIAANLTAPSVPANVNAIGQNLLNPASIAVSWSANLEADLQEYWVYRALAASVATVGAPVAIIPKGTTSFEDTSITVGLRYFYRVIAVDKGGLKSAGSQSTEVSDAALMPPTLAAPGNASTAASLNPEFRWLTVTHAQGYKVILYADAGGYTQHGATYATPPSLSAIYLGTPLVSGRTYYWRLAATTKGADQINSISAMWRFTAP
jgi:fibronectin type 3 domain-containing protein